MGDVISVELGYMDDQRAFGKPLDLDAAVSGVLSGNQESFRILVEAYYGYVYAICWSYMELREECMDAAQDTFIRTYQRLDTLRDPQKLPAFLVRTARNACLDRLRALRRARAMEQRFEEEMNRVGARKQCEPMAAEKSDMYGALHRLIQKLPAKTREVICLHYLEEMATKDIAAVLEISQAAVLKRLEYGRQLLRERLEKELKPVASLSPRERYLAVEALMAAVPFGSAPWSQFGAPKASGRSRWLQRKGLWGGAAVGTLATVALIVGFALHPAGAGKRAAATGDATAYTASVAPDAVVRDTIMPTATDDSAFVTDVQKTLEPETSDLTDSAVLAAKAPAATVLRLGPPPNELPGNVVKVLQELVLGFEVAHPGVSVEFTAGAAFDEWNATPDQLGDVMVLSSASLGSRSLLANYAEKGYIADLTERVADPEFNRDDFYPNTWDLSTYKSRTWGVPLMAHTWAIAVDSSKVDPKAIQARLTDWKSVVELAAAVGFDPDPMTSDGDSLLSLPGHFFWEGLFISAGGNPTLDQSFSPSSFAWQQASDQFAALAARNPESLADRSKRPFTQFHKRLSFCFVRDGLGEGTWTALQGTGASWVLLPFSAGMPLPPQAALVVGVKAGPPEREKQAWQLAQWLASPEAYAAYGEDLRIVPLRRSVVAGSDDAVRILGQHVASTAYHRPRLMNAEHFDDYKELVRSFAAPSSQGIKAAQVEGQYNLSGAATVE